MRVISGSARGTRLAAVPEGVRPTGDRVRESVFNALGQFFDGGAVLDLYAGTGALGIEALSRGCTSAVFVERERRVAAVIRENLRKTRLEDRAEVLVGEVRTVVGRLAREGRSFGLIFADPPYRIAAAEMEGVLPALATLLEPGGRLVVESDVEPEAPLPETDLAGESRRYGGTQITIFTKAADERE